MSRTSKALFLLYLLVGYGAFQAQEPYGELKAMVAQFATLNAEEAVSMSDSLAGVLETLLSEEGAMAGLPTSTDFMASVASSDRRLRVYTWNWAHTDRTSGYAGLVAFQAAADEDIRFTRLLDFNSADRPDDQQSYREADWHGALYYAMVPDAVDKDTWLLLGWDDADAQVNRKIIEPLQCRPKGIRFGAPVLQAEWGMQKRYVLEYADAVQVSLRYQEAERGKQSHPKRIVFDHLAPQEPHQAGITAFYGPDMTFDAFLPGKKGGAPWILQPNAPVSTTLPDDRPFVDPRPRNRSNKRR